METIGLIGIGLVGSSLLRRFRAAGFDCLGYDISEEAVNRAVADGMTAADSPADLGDAARRVVLSLPNSDVVETVVDGPDGLVHGLQRGDLVIDTTTSDPERCAQLAARLGGLTRDFSVPIVIDEATWRGAGSPARDFEREREVAVKGREGELDVYLLREARASALAA
jgi:class 3 adenylate cyclase